MPLPESATMISTLTADGDEVGEGEDWGTSRRLMMMDPVSVYFLAFE